MKLATKRLPGEVPWVPSFNYDCSEGHYIQADQPVSRCPAWSNIAGRREPCPGDLTRVGKGSRPRLRAVS